MNALSSNQRQYYCIYEVFSNNGTKNQKKIKKTNSKKKKPNRQRKIAYKKIIMIFFSSALISKICFRRCDHQIMKKNRGEGGMKGGGERQETKRRGNKIRFRKSALLARKNRKILR